MARIFEFEYIQHSKNENEKKECDFDKRIALLHFSRCRFIPHIKWQFEPRTRTTLICAFSMSMLTISKSIAICVKNDDVWMSTTGGGCSRPKRDAHRAVNIHLNIFYFVVRFVSFSGWLLFSIANLWLKWMNRTRPVILLFSSKFKPCLFARAFLTYVLQTYLIEANEMKSIGKYRLLELLNSCSTQSIYISSCHIFLLNEAIYVYLVVWSYI